MQSEAKWNRLTLNSVAHVLTLSLTSTVYSSDQKGSVWGKVDTTDITHVTGWVLEVQLKINIRIKTKLPQ